jgi:uncharacterized membrane protein YbhN (UPF0104 family)
LSDELRRARWSRGGRIAFAIVVAAVFAGVVWRDADQLRHVELTVSPGWLFAAAPVSLAGSALLPLAWRRLVAASGHRIGIRRALRIWCVSQTGRYLPTGAAAVASRAVLAAREGVPRAVTVATMAVELALLVGVSTTLALVALPAESLTWPARIALLAAGVGGLAALPFVVSAVSARVPRLDPHRAGGWRRRELYESELLFLANGAVKSIAFVLLAAALLPVDASDVVLLVGAVNGGAVAGIIGITPAGLGVREGAIAGILGHRYGLGDGAALAVAWRAWEIAIESVWLAIVHLPAFRPHSQMEAGSREDASSLRSSTRPPPVSPPT